MLRCCPSPIILAQTARCTGTQCVRERLPGDTHVSLRRGTQPKKNIDTRLIDLSKNRSQRPVDPESLTVWPNSRTAESHNRQAGHSCWNESAYVVVPVGSKRCALFLIFSPFPSFPPARSSTSCACGIPAQARRQRNPVLLAVPRLYCLHARDPRLSPPVPLLR